MLAAIDGAKSRINFETYVYKDGEIGDRFVDALARAAERGVTSSVVDPVGSGRLVDGPKNRDRLEKAGAKLAWFNPLGFFTVEVANYRTHRKTLVVDGDVAFTGGMGVADHWLGHAQDKEHWRDTQFQITGPAVRALEAVVLRELDRIRRPVGAGARSRDAAAADRRALDRAVEQPDVRREQHQADVPAGDRRREEDDRYPVAVHHARSDDPVEPRTGARARRQDPHAGRGRFTDAMPVKHASRYDYQGCSTGLDLLDQGSRFRVPADDDAHQGDDRRRRLQHHRLGEFRQSFVRAERRARRSASTDPELAATLTADFENDLKSSKRLDRDDVEEAAVLRRQAQRVVLELLRRVSSCSGRLACCGLDLILHERRERLDVLCGRPRCCQASFVTRSDTAMSRSKDSVSSRVTPSSQHRDVAFLVVRERSIVEVRRADRRPQAVDHHDLVMHHRAVVFVELHARVEQRPVEPHAVEPRDRACRC